MGSVIKGVVGAATGFVTGGPVGAVIGGVGGYMSGQASEAQEEAARAAGYTSAAAADQATALQRQMYTEGVARQAPWLEAGKNALAQMTEGTKPGGEYLRPFSMADYQADPGYAFRLKEGMRGLEQSAAARGSLLSGNTLKGITGYGQEMASQEYQNAYNRYQQQQGTAYNRLAGLAGTGQTTAAGMGQAGSQYATQAGVYGMQAAGDVGSSQLAAGQAKASAYQGFGNILGQAAGAWGSPMTQSNYSMWT